MLTLLSPAKVNLFLRVLGRREDGYHELASLFQAIDICDTIRLKDADADALTCSEPTLACDGSNFVATARDLFRQKTGVKQAFSIHIEKHIPMEAGLGGGSSNAATTLWGLNELSGRPATTDQLIEWAAELGADMAFFLSEGTAYCTGYGHVVSPVDALPQQSLWIVKPPYGLPTGDVYKALCVSALPQRNPKEHLSHCLGGTFDLFNDLEVPAFSLKPELLVIKSQLEGHGFDKVLLAGSGTSFICIGNGEPPFLPGLALYPAKFIRRQKDAWYA